MRASITLAALAIGLSGCPQRGKSGGRGGGGGSGHGTAEDCASPQDDDGDGLVNCEDGGCADSASCGEACENEADDDGDGLADCADDECIGLAACSYDRYAIFGGTASAVLHPGGHGASRLLTVRDASGVLQSFSGGGAPLGSCAWGFTRATFSGIEKFGNPTSPMDLDSRVGFEVEGDCRYDDSSLLSPEGAGQRFWYGATLPLYFDRFDAKFPWYQGAMTDSYRLYSSLGSLQRVTQSFELSEASFVLQ